ncbi:hypothetical protein ABNB59_06505 [Paenibacillus larvae]|uniref:DUF7210 domain-containing protein n=3 Tax=Paenibacillus larvae TaxID=1464 RepID=V9W8A7_9BACL|nr:hypothetical protein [Paenibacillus larvae]AHD06159.1 hypothetical protein ERIC2_c23700 [Paenibacillus larvae subsp. larvae DSM 25430]AQR77442.1 hypothetical protein BXP28_08865 [Paenibacillus larvae subsp. larvae]AVF21530.1 hypothetical protein ERICI_01652 [Paenibacillus larvae subsp. larvae]AVG12693.1 hypothetical protein ERICII_02326 [Paenibacillus larvae subsp. larvae DSM 25430]ETK30320.1 hypothetical protein ERIC1_1c38870 [Paenibacillus larvae subsp. larvae DSM 25719]
MAKKPDQTEADKKQLTAKKAQSQKEQYVKVQWVTNVKYRGNIYYAGQRTDVRDDDYSTLVNEKVIRLEEGQDEHVRE